jgi:hypothetical protein
LKVRRDESNDVIVPGWFGYLHEYSADPLGVCIVLEGKKAPRAYQWNRARDAFVAAGMKISKLATLRDVRPFAARRKTGKTCHPASGDQKETSDQPRVPRRPP